MKIKQESVPTTLLSRSSSTTLYNLFNHLMIQIYEKKTNLGAGA
jgi:hypothetical protein